MVAFQFWHVALVSLVAGAVQLVLVIVVCAVKDFMKVVVEIGGGEVTFHFGAFALTSESEGYSYYIVKNSGTSTLQAMLILCIFALFAGLASQAISISKYRIANHGPLFYMRLAHGLYAVSDLLLLIGLSAFTDFFNSHLFVDINGRKIEFYFSSAFAFGWTICVLFLLFLVALVVFVNCMLKITTVEASPSRSAPYETSA